MGEHELLWIGRTSLGTRARGSGGSLYGTVGRCSCGQRLKVNIAPSKGGKRELEALFRRHAANP